MIDDEASAIFVLWDDAVSRLTGYNVQQVNDLIAIQSGNGQNPEDQAFPNSILQPFIGKELLFKLRVRDLKLDQSTLKVSVSKVCPEEPIIAQFKADWESVRGAHDNDKIMVPTVSIKSYIIFK